MQFSRSFAARRRKSPVARQQQERQVVEAQAPVDFLPPDAKKSRRKEFGDSSTGIRKAATGVRYASGCQGSLRAPLGERCGPTWPSSHQAVRCAESTTPNRDIKMSIFKRETSELEKIDEVEGEIREFVRRDLAGRRRQHSNDGEMVVENITSLMQRVSLNSVHEIDRLVDELKMLRDQLLQESERVRRKIVEYASLSQTALQSTKTMAENLSHWRKAPDAPATIE